MRRAEPRARGGLGLATLAAMAVAIAACSDDNLARSRSDAGLGSRDGGEEGELPLRVGMTFQYRATLQHREPNGDEFDGTYTLSLRIESVDDQGRAASTLTFSGVDETDRAARGTWDAVRDYDSWVGRLGPSLAVDRLSGEAVTAVLSVAPAAPPPTEPQTGKLLPKPSPFFIDARNIDAIATAFTTGFADRGATFTDPAENAGQFRLAFSGPDAALFYFPTEKKTRALELHYDPRGFLTRIEENIGDSAAPPSSSCRLVLLQGP